MNRTLCVLKLQVELCDLLLPSFISKKHANGYDSIST